MAGDATLHEVVRIRQVRRKRLYAADGSIVELSVDDVEVLLDDRVIERFAELEVELRQGSTAVLEPLVDLLAEVEELVPADTSKLERALEAVRHDAEAGEPEQVIGVPEGEGETVSVDGSGEAHAAVEAVVLDGAPLAGGGAVAEPGGSTPAKIAKTRKEGKRRKAAAAGGDGTASRRAGR